MKAHLSFSLIRIPFICMALFVNFGCQSAITVPDDMPTHQMAFREVRINSKNSNKSAHTEEPRLGHYLEVKDKSHIKFSATAKMLGISSEVIGQFKNFSISMTKQPDIEKSVVEVAIDAKSIDTDNARRDRHLRKADFFDVEKYKTITFKSKKIKKLQGNEYEVNGNLTIKNKTTDITFQALAEPVDVSLNTWRIKGNTTFNRQKLGITYSSPFFLPDVGDEIQVTFDVLLRLKQP